MIDGRERILAGMEQGDWRKLEELFDRRRDGTAASRRFEERLTWHSRVWGDGTAATSRATLLGRLLKAERRLQREARS